MKQAEQGTVQNGCLTYSLNGKTYTTPIKTLRGDYKDAYGNTANRLRRWEKQSLSLARTIFIRNGFIAYNG